MRVGGVHTTERIYIYECAVFEKKVVNDVVRKTIKREKMLTNERTGSGKSVKKCSLRVSYDARVYIRVS